MKVLLDACVPRPLRRFLPDPTVCAAQEMSWGKLKNGALLREAESQFEALVTTDQNLCLLSTIFIASCQVKSVHPGRSIGIEEYPGVKDLYRFAESKRKKHGLPALGVGIV